MSFFRELDYSQDIKTVKGVQFSLLSPDEIKKRSAVKILSSDAYTGTIPVDGGLFDNRMGTIDSNKRCKSCGQNDTFCPGHMGYIELAKPMFYIQFMPTIKKLLSVICFKCSSALINNDQKDFVTKLNRQRRFEYITRDKTSSSKKTCPQCGEKQPDTISQGFHLSGQQHGVFAFVLEWKKEEEKNICMHAEDVLRHFRRITDEDAEFLGFGKMNRPEWMICIYFPVPPPCVRPSVRNDIGQRREDDLTHKLVEIVKTNNHLSEKIAKDAQQKEIMVLSMLLQYHMATFADNSATGIPIAKQRNYQPIKSVTERLKGKEGRIRGNLMGKRVDFSARSVISPDPYISIDELGMPLRIAMNLTFPEIVTQYNIHQLQEVVNNGSDVYPGAKYVRKTKDAKVIRLSGNQSIMLEEGDIVDRHLRNGDYVLFNRQPSLHKMSMMGHRIRIMKYNTMRLNVLVTPSYNADYDGDEMNIHVPQSLQTVVELKELAAVPTQIISPRYGAPIIVPVQDIALGIYLMTDKETRINTKSYGNMLSALNNFDGNPLSSSTITGRELISHIIPKNINLTMKGTTIKNGKLLEGRLNKTIYCNPSNGNNLLQSILKDYGPNMIRLFLDDTQRLICDWLFQRGFSMGVSDLYVSEKTRSEMVKIIDDGLVETMDFIGNMHSGDFENDTLDNNEEFFEGSMMYRLENIKNAATDVVTDNMLHKNQLLQMQESKSKGGIQNMQQMMVCLGQQSIQNKDTKGRAPYGLDDRTLPHFPKYDDGPASRGYVKNSFSSGLEPHEFFFHAMAGREGLIDTAVKSVTGDTSIIILEGDVPKYVKIGDWIDAHLKKSAAHIKHFKERRMELLSTEDEKIYIPTTDYEGNVTWGAVTAMTRHDPGSELYEIKTAGGRRVIVTESKSLLIWITELCHFKEVSTPLIKVGDFVPTTFNLTSSPISVKEMSCSAEKNIFQQVIGYFYSTCGKPETLSLDRNNGIFMGVYLGVGDISLGNQEIAITTSNDNVKTFIQEWFGEKNISSMETVEKITGYSSSISKLLDTFTGSCSDKYVPDAAFAAPEEFIIGILNGYFSVIGAISSRSIEAYSSSYRLTEGIAMLCSRIGIFAHISVNGISIKEEWAAKFADRIELIDEDRNAKLQNLKLPQKLHRAYNDVVLDEIIEINIIDAKKYPKVYDLTIPSTLNFGLANGLQVRDTSDTGYIQRKLVKVMEDCKVYHDLTVRNAMGKIIQFSYGGDSFDPVKMEAHGFPVATKMDDDLTCLSIEEMKKNFIISDSDLPELEKILGKTVYKKFLKDRSKMQAYYDDIIKARDFYFVHVCEGKASREAINYPINIVRILNNTKPGTGESLSPTYVVSTVALLREELRFRKILPKTDTFTMTDMYLTSMLNPKDLVMNRKMSKKAFDGIVEKIKHFFMDSIIHAGEMVGVLAAQSMAEPLTQLTLNTFHASGQASAAKSVQGVPRIKELLNASKNIKTPTLEIYPVAEIAEDSEKVQTLLNSLQTTQIKDILVKTEVYYEPDNTLDVIEEDKAFVKTYNEFMEELGISQRNNLSPWLLRLEFDKDKMFNRNLTILDVETALRMCMIVEDASIVSSDNNDAKLVMRIKMKSDVKSDMLTEIKDYERDINDVVVKGIRKIKKIIKRPARGRCDNYMEYDTESHEMQKKDYFVLESMGSNLPEVIVHPDVDSTRSISNDIHEICEVLGIEATRNIIIKQIKLAGEVMNNSVQDRHFQLLTDVMTMNGCITSIDRHGIKRNNIGPLAKSSFEETVDMLINAGMFHEHDRMCGVSANVMLGQMAHSGTGESELVVDNDKLINDYVVEAGMPRAPLDVEECKEKMLLASYNFDKLTEKTYIC